MVTASSSQGFEVLQQQQPKKNKNKNKNKKKEVATAEHDDDTSSSFVPIAESRTTKQSTNSKHSQHAAKHSSHSKKSNHADKSEHRNYHMPPLPLFTAIATYFGYGLLIAFGHLRDFFGRLFFKSKYVPEPGYAPVVSDFEGFYTRRLYHRIHDCWNRPVTGCPGAEIGVIERESQGYMKPLIATKRVRQCLNLGSYNYLGFGDPESPTKSDVARALDTFSVSAASPRTALGTTVLHRDLEKLVATFIGKEDSMIFGMGFGTNSTAIPSLMGPGCLIISDSNNHSSIASGCRTSGAVIKVFKHNNPAHLDQVIRKAIIEGQPRTHRPWKKIMIIVEGIYSMEGELCPLKQIVEVKNKYGVYLFVDEAHSIGAIGASGRGICEHAGVDPKEVDILMGTFTKSFGAVGGYVAASSAIISRLRHVCAGSVYSCSMSPTAVQQVISAMKIMMGMDGTDLGQRKLRQLRDNANWFRAELAARGAHVLGDHDSPVVPLMLYNPAKIPAFSRECYKRGLAVVVVGFPATPLLEARTRICISAAHTREQLEEALEAIDEVCDVVRLKYSKAWF